MQNAVEISEVATVLVSIPTLLDKYFEFIQKLRIPAHQYKSLVDGIRTGFITYENGFINFLTIWVDAESENATLGALWKILDKMKIRIAKGKLENRFGSLNFVLRTQIEEPCIAQSSRSTVAMAATRPTTQPQPSTEEDEVDHHDQTKMDDYPNGKRFALIVNVKENREGAVEDEENLVDVLEHSGFTVRICSLLTAKKIQDAIDKLITDISKLEAKNEPVGACLVALMSHGRAVDLMRVDDDTRLHLHNDIINKFCSIKAPKIFLVNMCRGDKRDFGKPDESDVSDDDDIGDDKDRTTVRKFLSQYQGTSSDIEEVDGPTWNDILIAHATYRDHKAYRSRSTGTIFIQAFCEKVKETAGTKKGADISLILKNVSNQVKNTKIKMKLDGAESSSTMFQVPTFEYIGFDRTFSMKYKD